MKLLMLDIETSPNEAYVWKSQLWSGHIGSHQITADGEILCYAAKFLGEKEMHFDSSYASGRKTMLRGIHKLLSAADVVVTYNGNKFDLTELNREFLLYQLGPTAPYKRLDLYAVARKTFRFASNKLDYICEALGIGKKTDSNFQLWVDCMNKDPAAWVTMEKYNKNDVVLLEGLYEYLLPWIDNHPNYGMYMDGRPVCPNCGSAHSQRRGYFFKKALKYLRFQCMGCGKWFAGTKAVRPDKKPVVAGI